MPPYNNNNDKIQESVFRHWKTALVIVLVAMLLTHVQSLNERTAELESTMKQATTQMHDMVRLLNEQVEQLLKYQETLASHLSAKAKPKPDAKLTP